MSKKVLTRGVVLTSSIIFLSAALSSCVPKTEYEDQRSKLQEAQSKVKELEETTDCDKDAFLQLKEQVQSFDLQNQELVEKNAALSKEIARIKVSESSGKTDALNCDQKMKFYAQETEQRLERVRVTYETTIKDLKAELDRMKAALEKQKADTAAAQAAAAQKNSKGHGKSSPKGKKSAAPSASQSQGSDPTAPQ